MKRLPDSIQQILKREFEAAKEVKGKKVFRTGVRHSLVEKSKEAYNKLSREERIDVLVPQSESVLQKCPIKLRESDVTEDEYEFNYNWPGNNGFVEEKNLQPGDVKRQKWFLQAGMLYDRIGELKGRYVSPFIDGKPQSYVSRAMPYYIPERDFTKNPSYHILKAEGAYVPQEGETLDYGSVANAYSGDIGKSTGGTQIFLLNALPTYLKHSSGNDETRRVLVEQNED